MKQITILLLFSLASITCSATGRKKLRELDRDLSRLVPTIVAIEARACPDTYVHPNPGLDSIVAETVGRLQKIQLQLALIEFSTLFRAGLIRDFTDMRSETDALLLALQLWQVTRADQDARVMALTPVDFRQPDSIHAQVKDSTGKTIRLISSIREPAYLGGQIMTDMRNLTAYVLRQEQAYIDTVVVAKLTDIHDLLSTQGLALKALSDAEEANRQQLELIRRNQEVAQHNQETVLTANRFGYYLQLVQATKRFCAYYRQADRLRAVGGRIPF